MQIIETERTYLRRLTLDDIGGVLRIFTDPEAMRYSPAESAQDEAAAERFILWNLEIYRTGGLGALAIIAKSTGTFIGQAGLIPQKVGVEVFYSLAREYWGQGFATEASMACRDYGFQTLDEARLVAIIHPQNARAINVARKLGMKDSGAHELWGRLNRLFEVYREGR